jgi:hypothetical protein
MATFGLGLQVCAPRSELARRRTGRARRLAPLPIYGGPLAGAERPAHSNPARLAKRATGATITS